MPDRRRFLELLPFHVNGTLDAEDNAWIEDYVKRHPQDADLAFARRLRDFYRQPLPDASAQADLERLIDRLRQARTPAGKPAPLWVRWFSMPGFAAAAASLALVQAGVIAYLLPRAAPQEPVFRSVPARPQAGAMLRVIFRPDADLGQILILLRGLDARIVAGPGPAGELWIEVARTRPVAEVAMALKNSRLVDDVMNVVP